MEKEIRLQGEIYIMQRQRTGDLKLIQELNRSIILDTIRKKDQFQEAK